MSSCLQIVDLKHVETHANFVILLPTKLPDDCELLVNQGVFRPELPPKPLSDHPGDCWSNWAASHTCSWSFQIQGKDRKIRCKQFLYDLGPISSIDHAALYDHYPEKMKHFAIDQDRIGWIGIDYNQKPAVCALAWGTNIEFRVTEGTFSEDELIQMLKSCIPANETTKAKLNIPFAKLSYWSRYPRYDQNMCSITYHPPSTFWKLRWPWAQTDHVWKIETSMKTKSLSYGKKTWIYNSTCSFPGFETQHIFFPDNGQRHQQLWIRSFPEAKSPLQKPQTGQLPETEVFSGKTSFKATSIPTSNGNIYLISEDQEIGPHDAVMWHEGNMVLIHVSCAQDHNVDEFKKLLMKNV